MLLRQQGRFLHFDAEIWTNVDTKHSVALISVHGYRYLRVLCAKLNVLCFNHI